MAFFILDANSQGYYMIQLLFSKIAKKLVINSKKTESITSFSFTADTDNTINKITVNER